MSVSGLDARFNGKYYVIGVSHRFQQGPNGDWQTLLRLDRADRGFYSLPEIGDEVLVTFENGDIAHPVIVGSLWNGKDKPPKGSDLACVPGPR